MLRDEFHRLFDRLGLIITREAEKALFFQLRYPNEPGQCNTLKVSASNLTFKASQHTAQYLSEIDRFMNCQTIETMFVHKLVAPMDRFAKHRTVAGRDFYDIHYFFIHGYSYHAPVIQERTGLEPKEYLEKLVGFIKKHVTQTIINEDLNTLLPPDRFQQIRKILIPETLALIHREMEKLGI